MPSSFNWAKCLGHQPPYLSLDASPRMGHERLLSDFMSLATTALRAFAARSGSEGGNTPQILCIDHSPQNLFKGQLKRAISKSIWLMTFKVPVTQVGPGESLDTHIVGSLSLKSRKNEKSGFLKNRISWSGSGFPDQRRGYAIGGQGLPVAKISDLQLLQFPRSSCSKTIIIYQI